MPKPINKFLNFAELFFQPSIIPGKWWERELGEFRNFWSPQSPVWPDLAKFHHFGKHLKVFGNLLLVYLFVFWPYFLAFFGNFAMPFSKFLLLFWLNIEQIVFPSGHTAPVTRTWKKNGFEHQKLFFHLLQTFIISLLRNKFDLDIFLSKKWSSIRIGIEMFGKIWIFFDSCVRSHLTACEGAPWLSLTE